MTEELNLTLFQSFHWYDPADGTFWDKISERAAEFEELGIHFIWLPPAYKTVEGPNGVGYGVYDLYDLGEFDQKGAVRTKYGTKEEYLACIKTLQEHGIKVIVDVVLNHRCGADQKEKVRVRNVDPKDRNKQIGEPFEKEVATKFTFPGRGGKYSPYIWDFNSFTAVEDPENDNHQEIYLIEHEYSQGFDQVPSDEFGNFDFLLGADVEFRNPAVREELKQWSEWYYTTVEFDGMRLDGLKHINSDFLNEWVEHVRNKADKELLVIGENWAESVEELLDYKKMSYGKIQLVDALLHGNFQKASTEKDYDLRKILDGSLVQAAPELAITFVDNHDTQPLQAMESTVEPWFQPFAYALILLRKEGMPCVFSTSLDGAKYADKGKDGQQQERELAPTKGIRELMRVRKEGAFGHQRDYFDQPHLIGWTREGTDTHPDSGCAVLLCNGEAGIKDMEVGKRHAGARFVDTMGNFEEEVEINQEGWGTFRVKEGSVAVWIRKKGQQT